MVLLLAASEMPDEMLEQTVELIGPLESMGPDYNHIQVPPPSLSPFSLGE